MLFNLVLNINKQTDVIWEGVDNVNKYRSTEM